jgi:dTMP kinase
MTGKFIVFEGGEGCGKSTQLKALQEYLQQCPQWQALQHSGLITGLVTTREPGGTALGKTLRQLLLHQEDADVISSQAELLLYAADRAQHIEQVVRPALAANQWVLCDRFTDSTLAYQGYGRGLDLDRIHQLNQLATGGLTADLTLWLQLDAAQGLARTQRRGTADRMEQAELAFHQRVQQGFTTLARQCPERIVPIDADGSIEAVGQNIQTVIDQYLQQWYPSRLTA